MSRLQLYSVYVTRDWLTGIKEELVYLNGSKAVSVDYMYNKDAVYERWDYAFDHQEAILQVAKKSKAYFDELRGKITSIENQIHDVVEAAKKLVCDRKVIRYEPRLHSALVRLTVSSDFCQEEYVAIDHSFSIQCEPVPLTRIEGRDIVVLCYQYGLNWFGFERKTGNLLARGSSKEKMLDAAMENIEKTPNFLELINVIDGGRRRLSEIPRAKDNEKALNIFLARMLR